MNLQELHENKKTKVVKKALKEHYELNMDFSQLNVKQTNSMLSRVRGLLKETRSTSAMHASHSNSAYLKLVMMEQALADHSFDLRKRMARIVVENEEVQKSQVILAAQDMIDNIQKMLEQVSKMNVEELNAVVNGIKNEFGTNEGEQYSQTAGETLKVLQDAISAAKTGLDSALGTVTGETTAAPTDAMGDEPGMDMGAEMPEPGAEMEMEPEAELPAEEEPEDTSLAGRERR